MLYMARCNSQLLSIRNVTDLHTDIVPKMLEDIKRPSRSFGIPKLRGLCHSDPDASRGKIRILSKSRSGITATRGARSGYLRFDEAAHASVDTIPWHSDDGWYDSNGQVLADVYDDGMAACLLQERDGIIAFDAVFCRRYLQSVSSGNWNERYARPEIATVSLS